MMGTVLQVSPRDIGGGAEKVAFDLHRAYLDRGLDSWLAVGHCSTDTINVIEIPAERGGRILGSLLRAAEALNVDHDRKSPRWVADRALRTAAAPGRMLRTQLGCEDFDFPATRHLLELPPRTPDVLHLHNLHGAYFDLRRLPDLATAVPTVITLHDVWLLTGHCAYTMDCDGWLKGCERCPDIGRPIAIRRDSSRFNLAVKRAALTGGLVHLAAPSRWLAEMVERSGVGSLVAETRVIPNGVDLNVFRPGDKAEAREALGLPDDSLVILFAARSAKVSPFKGYDVLEAALPAIARGLGGRKAIMVAVGQDAPDTVLEGMPVRFVPFIEDPATVARYYHAADLYLHPARAENMPLAVLEALACGAPVVASDAGGIPEIIEDGQSGLLFANGDPGALAAAALRVLGDEDLRERLARQGTERARSEFSFDKTVDAYLGWYTELADSSR